MSRGTMLAPAALVLALAAAGCLTASQQSRLQTDMAGVRQQVFDMQKSTAEILTKIEGMEETLSSQEGASPTRFADLESLIQSLADQVRTLGARLDDNTARMATLAHEIALARQQFRALDARVAAALATRGLPSPGATAIPPYGSSPATPGAPPTGSHPTEAPGAAAAGTVPPAPGALGTTTGSAPGSGATPGSIDLDMPPTTTASPMPPVTVAGTGGAADPGEAAAQEAAFRAAYADYTRGGYESALTGFQEFLRSYPNSPLAEGAEYYAGDCLFSQQRYEEASAAFTRVIERYPVSDKAPASHLKKGLCLLALKQTARGVIQLQHVIETYPRSEEARLARDHLRQLGLSVR